MKKLIIPIVFALFALTACAPKGADNNLVFTATVEGIDKTAITVSTDDNMSFTKALLSFDETVEIPKGLAVGQTVVAEILPEVRESHPAQATLVKITLKEDEDIKTVYKKITPEDAKALIDSETVTILDVRTQSEFDGGHIEGAILLPDTEISEKAEEVLTDKSAKILVYCRSGKRSEAAAKKLIEMGYTDVSDFGGIIDWPYETVK